MKIVGISCLPLLVAIFTVLGTHVPSQAQDPNFTQFYSAPLQLNPAFTGLVPHFRVATSYRRQWAQIPGALQTNAVSFDYNLADFNSGVGVMFLNDRLGLANFQSNQVALSYAYRIGLSESWKLIAGVQAGYTIRSAAYGSLRFGDQIEGGGGNSMENLGDFNAGLPSFSLGGLAYNQTFWMGFSLFHLNNPSELTEVGTFELPYRLAFNGGARIPINKGKPQTIEVAPAFLYQQQGGFDQLDIGFNLLYAPVLLGVWYRGIPVQQDLGGTASSDAIAFLTGLQIDAFFFGYSYDINVSGLAGRSGGSHEISIVWQPSHSGGKKTIHCPAFYNQMRR